MDQGNSKESKEIHEEDRPAHQELGKDTLGLVMKIFRSVRAEHENAVKKGSNGNVVDNLEDLPVGLFATIDWNHLWFLEVMLFHFQIRASCSEDNNAQSNRDGNNQTVKLSGWKAIDLGNHSIQLHAYRWHWCHCFCHVSGLWFSDYEFLVREGSFGISQDLEYEKEREGLLVTDKKNAIRANGFLLFSLFSCASSESCSYDFVRLMFSRVGVRINCQHHTNIASVKKEPPFAFRSHQKRMFFRNWLAGDKFLHARRTSQNNAIRKMNGVEYQSGSCTLVW